MPPPKTIIISPELQVYVDRFGELKDDRGLVAEVDGRIIGAVWVRIMFLFPFKKPTMRQSCI